MSSPSWTVAMKSVLKMIILMCDCTNRKEIEKKIELAGTFVFYPKIQNVMVIS